MSVNSFLKKAKKIEEQKNHPPQRHESGKKHAEHDESWLVSYADMTTLLCGFFIMMFSMAKLDEPQYEKVKESVAKQFGGEYKSPTEELARFVTNVLQESGIESETTVRSDPAGVSVVFQSTVFFDTLSADVRPQGQTTLNKLIDSISALQLKENKKYKIVVEGHTDSRPVLSGIFPTNWELSGARAARVVRMFLDRGFPADHLIAIGYADTRPELPSRTPAGTWDEKALSKNRRVVLRILEPKVDFIPVPQTGTGAETGGAAAGVGATGDGSPGGTGPGTEIAVTAPAADQDGSRQPSAISEPPASAPAQAPVQSSH